MIGFHKLSTSILLLFLLHKITADSDGSLESNSMSVSKGILSFGQQIVKEALNLREHKSEIISPLSIASVLYLLQLGAVHNTSHELERLLGISDVKNKKYIHQIFGELLDETTNDKSKPNISDNHIEYNLPLVHEISVANALFLANEFRIRGDYENAAKSIYKSEVSQMDFVKNGSFAKTHINKWVDTKTRGKISEILNRTPSRDTEMIVVSALYFKSHWWEDIGVETTLELPFYPNGLKRAPINVQTMLFSGLFKYHNSEKYDCQLIGLRYQKQITTMYILIPNNSTRYKLKEFQRKITADHIEEMINESRDVSISPLSVPKFKITNDLNLRGILMRLGVTRLFTRAADLSAIAVGPNERDLRYIPQTPNKSVDNLQMIKDSNKMVNPGLYVTDMIHKTQLDVNEVGTEGGAATVTLFDRILGLHVEVKTPFLILIRQDYTRLPLFYGPIFEP